MRVLVLCLAVIVSACSTPSPLALLAARQTAGDVRVDAVQVPLNPDDPTATTIGNFRYAGGLHLTSSQTDLLHGLSDLTMTGKDTILAVGDLGVFFEARLLFDASGRLAGVSESKISRLTGLDGQPLTDKTQADAEGLARLPNGDRLVSFERNHRIWLYPATGGLPRAVPSPRASFPSNEGMEALMSDPEAGPDAYMVGAEATGQTWRCRIVSGCVTGPALEMPKDFGLVALDQLPQGQLAYLIRAYDPVRGNRVSLRIRHSAITVAQLDLASPMTVDNFEGLTSIEGANGMRRFLLLSDDNASPTQRTLLLAFDWPAR